MVQLYSNYALQIENGLFKEFLFSGGSWMYFDVYYLILVVPALLVAAWAQMKVQSSFNCYSRVGAGMTGYEAARYILDQNGLYDVAIERISGSLTDHYDPRTNVVRLSDTVYGRATVAAMGVAAHECGHAVQYAQRYAPIQLRTAILPVTQIGSQLSMPLILLGFVLSIESLVTLGILLFSLATVFQLVTLPVEFNASSRAIRTLSAQGMVSGEEERGVRKVLTAAALTYVAALIVSAMQLLRLVLIARNRRD